MIAFQSGAVAIAELPLQLESGYVVVVRERPSRVVAWYLAISKALDELRAREDEESLRAASSARGWLIWLLTYSEAGVPWELSLTAPPAWTRDVSADVDFIGVVGAFALINRYAMRDVQNGTDPTALLTGDDWVRFTALVEASE